MDSMPTKIEQGYLDQGYRLPAGVTWAMIHAARAKYEIDAQFVPVASASDCCAWGVPYVDGKPMRWRN